jgi:hypothetical protein
MQFGFVLSLTPRLWPGDGFEQKVEKSWVRPKIE